MCSELGERAARRDGICPRSAVFYHWFSWRIIIPAPSSLSTQDMVYLPFSKIILIHNPFQMSYWLRGFSAILSQRCLLTIYTASSHNTCLQVAGRKKKRHLYNFEQFNNLTVVILYIHMHRFMNTISQGCRRMLICFLNIKVCIIYGQHYIDKSHDKPEVVAITHSPIIKY